MLFDDDLEVDVARAMKALEEAPALGVPWPTSPTEDLQVLRRIKAKHPQLDVGDLVERFLVWSPSARVGAA